MGVPVRDECIELEAEARRQLLVAGEHRARLDVSKGKGQ